MRSAYAILSVPSLGALGCTLNHMMNAKNSQLKLSRSWGQSFDLVSVPSSSGVTKFCSSCWVNGAYMVRDNESVRTASYLNS